ncbi:hypothetical protein COO60DRAFT_1635775 [Scenedesmus sp. NREL 46B-D3]|nr:hypothetical protein COO60DRAFT_1635775 [Scenedesmus sp. NREL 46B-D3]
MNEQLIKQYPLLDKKQKLHDESQQGELKLAPAVTKADEAGAASTMKRRLTDKLVLLVRAHMQQQHQAAKQQQQLLQQQASQCGRSPTTAHKAGESIREAAERALKEAIGPSQGQVYFVGNAPMAHLDLSSSSSSSSSNSSTDSTGSAPPPPADAAISSSSSSSSSRRPPARVFFHLAQVVNDPWDVSLQDSAGIEFAWVGKEELGQYLKDEALLALARKML